MDLFWVKLWCFHHSDLLLAIAMTLTLLSVLLGARTIYTTGRLIDLILKEMR